jgi:hypothetical protein
MSSIHDPTRLTAEPGTTSWLKSALSDARSQTPSIEAIDNLTLRVEATIAAGLPGPELATPAKAAAGSMSVGKVAVLGVGVAIGVFAGTAWKLNHAPRKLSEPAAVAVSAAPVMPPSSAPEAPAPKTTAAPPDDKLPTPDQPAIKPSAPTTNERDVRSSGLSEAALLDAARAAVKADPARALTLTQEFGKRFPKSVLTQEREVIAIEALVRLGRTSAAKARADAFARIFPGSAHQQKIDQLTRSQ